MKYLAAFLALFLTTSVFAAPGVLMPPPPGAAAVVTVSAPQSVFVLQGEITAATGMGFDLYAKAAKAMDTEMTILIDSPGGDATVSAAIFNAIKAHPKPSHCVVVGSAASGAFFVLQACTERLAVPGAELMTHRMRIVLPFVGKIKAKHPVIPDVALVVATPTPDQMLANAEEQVKQAKQALLEELAMNQKIAARLGMPLEHYTRKIAAGDWELTAPNALRVNAIDAILGAPAP